MMKIHDWKKGSGLSMVTCYDAWSARLIAESPIDAVLVGDSSAMVMHGHDTTINIDTPTLALHTAAVARGLGGKKFLVADMPFLSFRKSLDHVLDAVDLLMKAGAHAIKIEGVSGHEAVIKHVAQSGVPVMAHIGLTPQSVHTLGGYRVQGRNHETARKLFDEAKKLEELGCFAIVLECVPHGLASEITGSLRIPTIGIGAGSECDGQILVLQDMLGMGHMKLKFNRPFMDGKALIAEALSNYSQAVKSKQFPSPAESFE